MKGMLKKQFCVTAICVLAAVFALDFQYPAGAQTFPTNPSRSSFPGHRAGDGHYGEGCQSIR